MKEKKRTIQFRLLQKEKDIFEDAAEFAGLSCSSWMRTRLKKAANEELKTKHIAQQKQNTGLANGEISDDYDDY